MEIAQDILVKNLETYKNGLIKLIGEKVMDKLIQSVGGDEVLMNATYSNLADSGSAFNGSFIKNVIRMTRIANDINNILPEAYRAVPQSIYKVCMLSQISKTLLFKENDNNWEIVNRGILYKYSKLDGALRVGERSVLLCMNAGVKFNEFEFEAMKILDKTTEDDSFTKYFSSPLSTVVRQAAEIITLTNRLSVNGENQ